MEDGARKTFARGAIAWMAQNPVAANLLMRFWLETRPSDPLRPEQASVFATLSHEEA